MKQVARRLRDGRLELADVAQPRPGAGSVSVRLAASIVSAGTERATLEVARKGLIGKARARPDQARQVIERVRREGVLSTWQLVKQRLDELGPLGYSAAGRVEQVGEEVSGIAPGDRVAIAGGDYASHAELDVVPSLLCAPIPDGVGFEDAAFATLGSIAMNGFRLGEAELGGTVAVIGLGPVGQLATRIARAAGCTVLATDLDPDLVDMAAAQPGVEARPRDRLSPRDAWFDRADAVLVCAATASDDPVLLAASLCRDRGSVVVVGDVGMDLPRAPFYEKELQLRLARSYGPGRHDPEYEQHGHDYPIGYARWTIQRNMGAFLDLVAAGSVKPAELLTHRFPFERAEEAFSALDGEEPVVGVLLDYSAQRPVTALPARSVRHSGRLRVGVIGAGSFATGTLVPGLLAAGLEPVTVASAKGLSAEGARRQFGFSRVDASADEVIAADDLDLVVIATRHDSHAELAARALRRGVATYVEKPLALDAAGLTLVNDALLESSAPLFVGFNRRFAPLSNELRQTFEGPRLTRIRINAGPLPNHWLNDPSLGGGRLLGEACHFVDLLLHLTPSDPRRVHAAGYPSQPSLPRVSADNFVITIEFEDGGIGTISYAADAPTASGKERVEVSGDAGYAVIDDFKRGDLWGERGRRSLGRRRKQDKGFDAQYAMVADVLAGRAEPPDPDSYLLTTVSTLAAARSLSSGVVESVLEPEAEDAPRDAATPR